MRLPHSEEDGPETSQSVTFTTSFELETDLEHPLIRGEVERVVGDDEFSAALARLLAWGDVAADQRILRVPETETPKGDWFGGESPITVNDERGQPIRHLKRQQSQVLWEQMRKAGLRARFFSMLLDEALVRIGTKYDPDRDTVASAFRAQFIQKEDAASFGRALYYYWQGDYADASRVALPSIEAVIRSLVQAAHGNSYVEPKGGRDGHESTLGALIEMLPASLPEAFRWDLRAILTDPLGLNLRNVHLHGLARPERSHDAAIILYTAARLTLITASAHSETDA